MKKIFYYILGVATLLAAASCEKAPEWNNNEGSEQALTLTFSCGDLATRTVAGVSNENLIKQIDYFFFPYNAEGTVDPDTKYVYKGQYIPEDDGLAGTYTETIEPGVLSKIFPDGNMTAVVMAIANYVGKYGPTAETPETTIPEDADTWAELHALEVGPTFFKDGGAGFQLRWPRKMDPTDEDLFFVMAADSVEVSLNTTGNFAINTEVPLKRLASKVTVDFTYQEYTDEKGIRWAPQPNDKETRVYLSNAIEHTTIGGPLDQETHPFVADSWGTATQPLGDGTRDIFEYAYDFMKDIPTVSGKKTAHYYTYPISMEEGDDNQPYLKLVLPWYGYKTIGGQEVLYKQKEVYYKIVLPSKTICDPNMVYQFSVTVNIIGSEREVLVTGEEYTVKDWSSDEAISSNVGLGRYISLDIPRDTYDMYGNSVQILYVSSGEVEISKLQIYKMDMRNTPVERDYYANDTDGTTPITYSKPESTTDAAGVTLPNWVTIQGSQLVINHTLNTNINQDGVDISPYTFVVTLHLKGVTGIQFDRTVTITQYPPIYVETRLTTNRSTAWLNNVQYTRTPTWVYNNLGQNGNQTYQSPGCLGQIGMGNNENSTSKEKTVVCVTTLSSLSEAMINSYISIIGAAPVIGDPRTLLSEKRPSSTHATGSWGNQDLGDSNNGYLSEYRYADPAKANVIAPKIMVAGGYGSSQDSNKPTWIQTVERCAAYQEDGYPAGRWRLPTEAEMMFVKTLAEERGVIPNPFYSGNRYWACSGRYFYQGNFTDGADSGRSSRCVYDLWYWGDEPVATGTAAEAWLGFRTSK